MADSAHMESTSEEKREILRKFKIAKKTSLGHLDCTEIRTERHGYKSPQTKIHLYYFVNP